MQDEQFTAAMRQAVAQRGADYRFQFSQPGATIHGIPQYQTRDGEGACLIGYALMIVDKKACPPYGASLGARAALSPLGLSVKVTTAARVAQIAQDDCHSWGDCLWLYEWVLNNYYGQGLGGQPSSRVLSLAQQALRNVRTRENVDVAVEAFATMAAQAEMLNATFTAMAEKPTYTYSVPTTTYATGGIVQSDVINIADLYGKTTVNYAWAGNPPPVQFTEYFTKQELCAAVSG